MRTVQILAFDDMEVLDYAGPYEVFTVAGELTSPSAFTVASVGVSDRPVGRGGFTVLPDHSLDDAPPADVLIIPGGKGSRALLADERLLDWVRDRAGRTELLLTVCTGALPVASTGLFDGLEVTTHHTAFDLLADIAPSATVLRGPRFVRSSDAIRTSAGVSAGVDLALDVVRELAGPETHAAVVEEMEWMWGTG
ncbi:DJ-1/PfpI family protein [Williamsia sp.]|uniref:DJ-1/PfpI family protein n=1 Tax=Williamsia sp. TaxID=1872085 RepID=UPI001A24BD53|nr:DJ-1/PfpI family protein [Williamsia sp.]MBJ7291818.1 DJ-1/PfpI family protein [Williamsia sp.]